MTCADVSKPAVDNAAARAGETDTARLEAEAARERQRDLEQVEALNAWRRARR